MTTSTAFSSHPDPGLVAGVPRSAAEVRAALEAAGLTPSRALGQSFLIDPFVADAEAALAGTGAGEGVVEVGGGLGLLTEALVRRGFAPIVVIERDPRLVRHLRRTFGSRVEVVAGDASRVPLPSTGTVVGNLPFSTGTRILQRCWKAGVRRVVALLQREVVDRLTAEPGSKTYGRLTIQAALYGSVESFQVVPGRSFEPQPEVDGRLCRFDARTDPIPVPSVERFESMMRLLFSSRRKQLGNLLPRVVHPPHRPGDIASTAGWPVEWNRLRPEDLPPDAYFRLATVLAGPARGPRPATR